MSRLASLFSAQTRRPSMTAPTQNREGYPAFEADDKTQYTQTLLTNTFGKTYYASQRDLVKEGLELHDKMLQSDPEFMAKAAAYARNRGYMRSQPTVALAKLMGYKGTSEEVQRRRGVAEKVFGKVIKTPNDLLDLFVLMESFGAVPNGRRIKRMVSSWLNEKMSEYWAIKYGTTKKGAWNMSRVIKHVHPGHNELYRYLRYRKKDDKWAADISELAQVKAFEALKGASTDTDKVRLITEGRLPHEVATSFAGSSKVVWDAIVPQLPVFALLKNLATLERHGVLDTNRKLIEGKLTDPEVIKRSRILPFRFLTASEHVASAWCVDALRESLELSFENIPDVKGRTVIALDISGSMSGQFLRVASIFAISLMKKADLDGRLLLFDTRLEEFRVSKRDSILTQAQRIRARGGTDTSLPVRWLLQQGEKTDNFIMITDEQQNAGTPFCDVLARYKHQVAPELKTFVVDVSPYRSYLLPTDLPDVSYIFGWSDQVLQFISLASEGWDAMASYISEQKL